MPSFLNIPAVLAVAVAGALLAYAAYRRSKRRTAPDLRSEVRDERDFVRAVLEALPEQIERAKRSRAASAHAAGNAGSEALRQLLGEMDLDLSEAALLRSQLSAADSDSKALSELDLEIKLVEVLGLSLRANTLSDKYRAANFVQETDSEILTDDTEALLREAS